jgi:hypothetical protein
MSQLRIILTQGGEKAITHTNAAVKFIIQLSSNDERTRRQLSDTIGKAYPGAVDYQVPTLFEAVCNEAYENSNVFYKQAVIFWFMLFDPALFGAYMLHGETDIVRNEFMKALKNATSCFISGLRMNGEKINPSVSIVERTTGHFVGHLRSFFIAL